MTIHQETTTAATILKKESNDISKKKFKANKNLRDYFQY